MIGVPRDVRYNPSIRNVTSFLMNFLSTLKLDQIKLKRLNQQKMFQAHSKKGKFKLRKKQKEWIILKN